ncbi:S-adenosyl-L-methionine-dependent methyltransferase [Lichtheimia hyalospora FSU 10163]|nr:S-adenosyl-L-methionine-dependent methyltransferase [Lichtheimia hyalospora FSU 10163]
MVMAADVVDNLNNIVRFPTVEDCEPPPKLFSTPQKPSQTWIKEKATDQVTGAVAIPVVNSAIRDRVLFDKPLQYVLGTQPFGELDIVTRPPVLIPRWETEEWVHRLIDMLKPRLQDPTTPFRILDICTGTGCIALALASQLPNVHVTAIDIADEAIALARHNQHIHAIQSVEFHKMDVFNLQAPVSTSEPFDLVVANPPYITKDEYALLDPCVKDWEDQRALLADDNGLAVHKRIATLCKTSQFLRPSGSHQVPTLTEILAKSFRNVTTWKDLAGVERVIVAY